MTCSQLTQVVVPSARRLHSCLNERAEAREGICLLGGVGRDVGRAFAPDADAPLGPGTWEETAELEPHVAKEKAEAQRSNCSSDVTQLTSAHPSHAPAPAQAPLRTQPWAVPAGPLWALGAEQGEQPSTLHSALCARPLGIADLGDRAPQSPPGFVKLLLVWDSGRPCFSSLQGPVPGGRTSKESAKKLLEMHKLCFSNPN